MKTWFTIFLLSCANVWLCRRSKGSFTYDVSYKMGGGVSQFQIFFDKRRGEVSYFQIFYDKGGRVSLIFSDPSDFKHADLAKC